MPCVCVCVCVLIGERRHRACEVSLPSQLATAHRPQKPKAIEQRVCGGASTCAFDARLPSEGWGGAVIEEAPSMARARALSL